MVERARIDAGFGFKVHPQMLGTPAANHHHVGGGVIEMELTGRAERSCFGSVSCGNS